MQTANQTIFLLHHILHNPEVKARVYEELASVLPSDSGEVWTPQLIKQLTYLQACVTEVLRFATINIKFRSSLLDPFFFWQVESCNSERCEMFGDTVRLSRLSHTSGGIYLIVTIRIPNKKDHPNSL